MGSGKITHLLIREITINSGADVNVYISTTICHNASFSFIYVAKIL